MSLLDLIIRANSGKKDGAQKRFAKRIGVSEGAVSQWIRGTYGPDDGLKPKVAKELGVTIEDLEKILKLKEAFKSSKISNIVDVGPAQFIPVVGSVSADNFDLDFDAVPEDFLPIPPMKIPGNKKVVAIKVSGDCMEPTLHDGEYVVVAETDIPPSNGKLAIFILDGGRTLKRIFRHKDHVELRPDNPKHKSIKVATNNLQCVGVVMMSVRKEL